MQCQVPVYDGYKKSTFDSFFVSRNIVVLCWLPCRGSGGPWKKLESHLYAVKKTILETREEGKKVDCYQLKGAVVAMCGLQAKQPAR